MRLAPLHPVLRALAARRVARLARALADPAAAQARVLAHLVARAASTAFGRAHDFADIASVADFQARVPVRGYPEMRPWLARTLAGEADVLWPGRPARFAQTSGTTAGDKTLPVTRALIAAHRRALWDALAHDLHATGDAGLLDGRALFLSGSSALTPLGDDPRRRVGDLSGIMYETAPGWLRGRAYPSPRVAALRDWEARLEALAAETVGADIRLLGGMPSWTLVFFERLRARAGGRPVGAIWPNFRLLLHGGVHVAPFRARLAEAIGRPYRTRELYPASEGFLGIETEPGEGLTLLPDGGLFFEFVPLARLGEAHPPRHTLGEVEVGPVYAVVLSSCAGLFGYLLGDTVRFLATRPPRVVIAGRTRHFVNAFGENVIVEEVEQAMAAAVAATGAQVVEYTVAPRFPAAGGARGGHEWVVEFARAPGEPGAFAAALDARLVTLNTDYRTKRRGDVGLAPPVVTGVPAGTFHGWLREAGKLGGQHKVPRVTNDRALADALRARATLASRCAASEPSRPPSSSC